MPTPAGAESDDFTTWKNNVDGLLARLMRSANSRPTLYLNAGEFPITGDGELTATNATADVRVVIQNGALRLEEWSGVSWNTVTSLTDLLARIEALETP